ncbi:MAG: glutamate-5-semialdehyde dehydrogenase [Deltaproteobacteria bacterium]|nr:glutamate-5-semialdehyde dehydrogenase [Deltaproteobacteria bacterium]
MSPSPAPRPAHDVAAELCRRARAAARALNAASTADKDRALHATARLLRERTDTLAEQSRRDVEAATAAGLKGALLDRLKLDGARVEALARAVLEVAALPDPVGRLEDVTPRPSGIQAGRMRVPLGVILMVYEARPNVTVEAAALALKSGNAVLLRGGKEALNANRALSALFAEALREAGLPAEAAQLVEDPDRSVLEALLPRRGDIELCIPRGGVDLIRKVAAEARMPVVEHFQGICHVYVDDAADLGMALDVVRNGKVQRPGVCNATECVLVHSAVAARFLPLLHDELSRANVELRGCAESRRHVPAMKAATEQDWDTEFLDLVLAVKVVDGVDAALEFIARHGSRHSESIITMRHDRAMRFLREVDASCVLVNASTRFNDGGELGLGAEMGISTTKLHAYGPMGLEELTARKWVVLGHGECRGEQPRRRAN